MDIRNYFSKEDLDFRESLAINKNNIEDAIMNFSVTVFDINYMLAVAEDSVAKSKISLEKIAALKEKSEKNKAKLDKEKITERDLDRAINLSSLYDEEYIKYLDYKKAFAILLAKQKALSAKEKMITNATYLLQREVAATSKEKIRKEF